MKNYPVIYFAILFSSGIAAGAYISPPMYILSIFISISILITLIYIRFKTYLVKSLLIIIPFISVFILGSLYYSPSPEMPHKKELHKEEVLFYGTVSDVNISGKDELRFTADSDSIIYNNSSLVYNGSFYCVIRGSREALFPGYRFLMNGIYVKGKNIRNPGEFNYEDHLMKSGISGYIYSLSDSSLIVTEKDEDLLKGIIFRVRNHIAGIFDHVNNESTSAFLKGILLADRRDIDYELRAGFINSGTAHVLAVSGLHVGFIILIIVFLTGRLNIYVRYAVTIISLALFMFISGAPPSVLRASLMAIFLSAGYLTNRSTNIFNSLALSALLILIIDPSQLFLAGFQLSYAAVISIGLFYPFLRDKINSLEIQNNYLRNILLLSAVTISAQIGTLPLVLFYFYKLSLISLIANLLIIPLIGMIIASAFITIITSLVFIKLAAAAGAANDLLSAVLFGLVNAAGNYKFSFLWVHDFSAADCLVSYILLVFLYVFIRKMNSWYTASIVTILVITAAVVFAGLDNKNLLKDNLLNCYVIDVGQGDAILLKFASGKTALIDAGDVTASFDSGERIIEPLLNYFGIKKIDYAFVSHLDSDHYSGFVHLVKKGYINYMFKPAPDSSVNEVRFEKFLSESGVNFSYYSGEEITIDQAKIYILDNSTIRLSRNNSNDLSAVLLIKYGETAMLFTGDAGFKSEEYYMQKYGGFLKANVLKVSHHGSSTATSEKFISHLNAEISLISAGEKNKFGHPTKKTLERLNKNNQQVYRTDIEGGILLRSDGYKIEKVNWKEK
jgi:competence protein ComEC